MRVTVAARCRGDTASTSWMVEQLGLAMMAPRPVPSRMLPLTSGTTRGMSGSRRKCELLSMTVQPALAARGAYLAEMLPPAENSAKSQPLKSNLSRSSTTTLLPANSMACPADRSEEHTSELQSRGHLVCRLLL